MKLKIWNPYGIGISNFEFHQNPRTFIFWDKKRGVFDLKNNLRKKNSRILMKLKIWNPYAIRISNFEFHQNPMKINQMDFL